MSIRHVLTALTLLAVTCTAAAFERPFPATAKRGVMSPSDYPAIIMDGTTRNLPPGARIWNIMNLTETPGSLAGGKYVVNYTEDLQGDIDRIWILTVEEANQPAPNKKP